MTELRIDGWLCRVEHHATHHSIVLQAPDSVASHRWILGGDSFPALSATRTSLQWAESRGFFSWTPKTRSFTEKFSVEHATIQEGSFQLETILSGHQVNPERKNTLTLRLTPRSEVECAFTMESKDADWKGLRLSVKCDPKERLFGAGAQFTHVNLKGHRFPIISQEPGIGRGVQPLTSLLNLSYGAGGTEVNSNAPAGHFISTEGYGWMTDNTAPVFLDFTHAEYHALEVEAPLFTGCFFTGSSPKALTETYTHHCGRMVPLPPWVHEGAIIGLQGGTSALNDRKERLEKAQAAIAGYWLQDWVGQRTTSVGKQLWWNWELDEQHYPDWTERVEEEAHPPLLTYTNPFLVDPEEKGTFQRNLYQEALERGFLVTNREGRAYPITNTSFDAALVDLGNPEARTWLKEVLKAQITETGSSGWMADFGEALPFDSVLGSGKVPLDYHNQYPVDWASLNREALRELDVEGKVFFFTRGGHTKSPGSSTCFWLGDQLTSWHRSDGIWSAVAGLLSSGFSGFSLNHSDVGGYTTTAVPGLPKWLPGIVFRRSVELLMRWTELNTFTALLRTHEGNRPEVNHQIWDSDEALAHFSHFSQVFRELAPYRKHLETEAHTYGYPLVRHPYFVCPEETCTKDIHDQFFLGDDLLVAPVLEQGMKSRRVWIPKGEWVGLLDSSTPPSGFHSVPTPMGSPLAWVRQNSPWKNVFESVRALGAWGNER